MTDKETEQDALELAVQSFAEHITAHHIKSVEYRVSNGLVDFRVIAEVKGGSDGEPKAEG